MLAPAALSMGLLFAVGLAGAFVESLGGPGEWTLRHYRELVADAEFFHSLRLTLFVSVVATALSAIAGLGMALALQPAIRRFQFLTTLLQAPVALPHLAMALVLINVAAPSGLAARLAYAFGLIQTPGQFPELHDAYGAGPIGLAAAVGAVERG